jgi:hypothetical protein
MADVLEFDLFGDGRWILAFDGRVLEIFGSVHPGWNVNNLVSVDSWRIHVTHLNVEVTGPDKKGYRAVNFCSHSDPTGAFKAKEVTESQWNRLQPFLETVEAATGSVASSNASDQLLATKMTALQALLSQHDVHLSSQPDQVRNTVIGDLRAAGVAIDPDTLVMRLTGPGQVDAVLEVYQLHGLLPRDASIR